MQDVKYNGIYGSSIGVFLKERPPIPAARRRKEEYEIPGRDGTLTYTKSDYEKEEIKLKFNFISKSEQDWNNKAEKAKEWLLSGGTQLIFSDDPDHFYKVTAVEIDTIDRPSARVGTFTVKITFESGLRYLLSGTKEIAYTAAKNNPYLLCKPIYKIIGEGVCTLTVNGKKVTANVGQNLTIDTELIMAYRTDGTLQNTAITGNYDDLYLIPGLNTISVTPAFTLKIIPNWRCL